MALRLDSGVMNCVRPLRTQAKEAFWQARCVLP